MIVTAAAEKGTTVTCAPKVIVTGAGLMRLLVRNAIVTGHYLLKMLPQNLVRKLPLSLLKKRLTVPKCDFISSCYCVSVVNL